MEEDRISLEKKIEALKKNKDNPYIKDKYKDLIPTAIEKLQEQLHALDPSETNDLPNMDSQSIDSLSLSNGNPFMQMLLEMFPNRVGNEFESFIVLESVVNPDMVDWDDMDPSVFNSSTRSQKEKHLPPMRVHFDGTEAIGRDIVNLYIEVFELGSGNFLGADVYKNGKIVGDYSYNGRWWPGPGKLRRLEDYKERPYKFMPGDKIMLKDPSGESPFISKNSGSIINAKGFPKNTTDLADKYYKVKSDFDGSVSLQFESNLMPLSTSEDSYQEGINVTDVENSVIVLPPVDNIITGQNTTGFSINDRILIPNPPGSAFDYRGLVIENISENEIFCKNPNGQGKAIVIDINDPSIKLVKNWFDIYLYHWAALGHTAEILKTSDNVVAQYIGQEFDEPTLPFFIQVANFRHVLLKNILIESRIKEFNDNWREFVISIYDPNPELSIEHRIHLQTCIFKKFLNPTEYEDMIRSTDDVRSNLLKIILNTPTIFSHSDDESQEVRLHYFNSDTHAYISQVDCGVGSQDFGCVVWNGDPDNGEWGSISISELITNGFRLDLNFVPVKFTEVLKKKGGSQTISDEFDFDSLSKQSNRIVRFYIAQIIQEWGGVEFSDIREEYDVKNDDLTINFELTKRHVDGISIIRVNHGDLSINSDNFSSTYDLPEQQVYAQSFVFPIISFSKAREIIANSMSWIDDRSQNEVYPFASFLRDHAEEHIGKKTSVKTIKSLTQDEQSKLKAEYRKHALDKPKSNKKLKLTKELKAHGVTQDHINQVNKTGESITIRVSDMNKGIGRPTDQDKTRQALKPGKRLTPQGTIYYEYRQNRADKSKNI